MRIFIILLIFNLLALSLGQSFFDTYVKKFLESIFNNGRNNNNPNRGDSFGGNRGDSFNDNRGDSFDGNRGDPFGGNRGDWFGENRGDSFDDNRGDSYGSSSNGNRFDPYGSGSNQGNRQNSNNGNNGNNNSRGPARGSSGSISNMKPQNCDCSLQSDNRIAGGKQGQFIPWLVSLGYVFKTNQGKIHYSHFCGGSIVNSQTILTAGHCLKDLNRTSMSNYLVRFGLVDLNDAVTKSNTAQWADFTINEKYARDTSENDNDIGIIKLKTPIDLKNSKAKAACLDFTKNYSQYLSISGWGRTNAFGRHNQTGAELPTRLLELDMVEDKSKSTNYIISAVGKAKNSGTCSGDSGSPLQSKNTRKTTVVGLVRYGVSNRDGVFCLSNTGFVRLAAHTKFIENLVGSQNLCRA